MTESVAELEHVFRRFDGGRIVALADVSLTVAPGELLAVTGPSGSGKSTLLNLMSGLDEPSAGEVRVGGRRPASRAEWTRVRAERIGFVFQSFNLLAAFTARENVELALFGQVRDGRERARRAATLLERVGLAARSAALPCELSVGERQRVAVARAVANRPALLLADEPTGNLDSASAAAVIELLEDLQSEEGSALVVVSHDEAVVRRLPRRVELRDGRVVADG